MVPHRFVLEVAVSNVAGAVTAHEAGADRLELSTALVTGGLTPSFGLVQEVCRLVPLPVLVMLRPRPGDFCYDSSEITVMLRDLESFLRLPITGFVFGLLTLRKRINRQSSERLMKALSLSGKTAVFHRAFDGVDHRQGALDELIDLGFHRVLTSGGEPTALAGAEQIAELREQAWGHIELLPAGGIRAGNVVQLLRHTGCDQVHGSFQSSPPVTMPAFGNREFPEQAEIVAVRKILDDLVSPSSPLSL